MAIETSSLTVLLFQTFCWFLFTLFMTAHGGEKDIYCLRSIKESLEDPNGYLSSNWDFNNKTEGFICKFTGVECWNPDENRVLNLKLSNVGLKGQFPSGIQNCTALTGLNLSRNEFLGPIPSDILQLLPYVTSLDLSSNKFSGAIPESIVNCTFLNTLRLDNNQLSGEIPGEIAGLRRLKRFSVANNYLSGPVPSLQDGVVTADSYANNRGLCGRPLVPCSKFSKDVVNSFKEGAAVGFSLSVTYVVAINCFCYMKKKKKKKKKRPRKRKYFLRFEVYEPDAKLLEKERKEISKLETFAPIISFMELYDATECFSTDNDIGLGKMGMMCQARLHNGLLLAVKRLYDPDLFKRQFVSEIMILGRYRHRNLIPLLGFCIEREERILAYQFMPNGSLSDWLNRLENSAMRFDWPVRVKIALGIARGLAWLHHNLHIVHLRLCCECILLDQNFDPKISNFGDAKCMSPNLNDDLDFSFEVNNGSNELGLEKEDVHDFGKVLFELITGKKLGQIPDFSNGSGNLLSFIELAIEKSLIEKGFEGEILTLLQIACDCTEHIPDERPTMLEVYKKMSVISERHGVVHDDAESDMTSKRFEIDSATSSDQIVELTEHTPRE